MKTHKDCFWHNPIKNKCDYGGELYSLGHEFEPGEEDEEVDCCKFTPKANPIKRK